MEIRMSVHVRVYVCENVSKRMDMRMRNKQYKIFIEIGETVRDEISSTTTVVHEDDDDKLQ